MIIPSKIKLQIANLMDSYLSKISTFLRKDNGGILIIAGFSIVALMTLSAISIEVARVTYVESRLAYAVDAAAIAGGRYDVTEAEDNARRIFFANFPQDFMGVHVEPTITISGDNVFVTVDAISEMPTIIGKVAGVDSLRVNALAQVKREMAGLQLTMVLDISGLTDFRQIMDNIRIASKGLVDTIYDGVTNTSSTAISVVPYTGVVNVGTEHTDWLHTALNPPYVQHLLSDFPLLSPWEGCVGARKDPLEETDDPPSVEKWPVYFTETTMPEPNDATPRDNDWEVNADGSVNVVTVIKDGKGAKGRIKVGPHRSCPMPLLPLSNDRNVIKNYLDSVDTVFGGGTFSSLGMGWGWRTLSEKWIGLWGAFDPKPKDEPHNLRAMIVLINEGNRWLDETHQPTGDPTAYGRVEDGKLGTTTMNLTKYEIERKVDTLCNAIKDDGIEVYTVSLMVDDSATRDLYGSCASKPKWYWNVNSAAELPDVFQEIARELLRIRIVK